MYFILGVRDNKWDYKTPNLAKQQAHNTGLYAYNGLWMAGFGEYPVKGSNCYVFWIKNIDDTHATIEIVTTAWYSLTIALDEARNFVLSQNTWSPGAIAIRQIL